MTKVVPDASVVAKWLVAEPLSDKALSLLADETELIAPDLLPTEVGNVLWKKVRRGELDAAQAHDRFAVLGQMRVQLVTTSELHGDALKLAIETRRSMYDALHLSLARREGCAFATADERFVNALRDTPHAERIVWLGAL